MKIGIVGVGTMGSRMAAAVADAGHELMVRDIDDEVAQAVADRTGGQIAPQPAVLADWCEVVLLSLPMPSDVRDVVSGISGLLEADALPDVIVDLSTVDPISTQEREREAAARDVGYIDAPVLGRPHRCGHWTLPVGGHERSLELARPALDVLADRVVHIGEAGSGNALKLLNNLMFGAINAITVEALTIARRLGVDLRVLYETIAESNAASVSNLFLEIAPKIIDGDTSPDFALDLLQKDNLLALNMARAVGVPTVVGDAVTILNAFGQDRDLGALDTSALTKVFESGGSE